MMIIYNVYHLNLFIGILSVNNSNNNNNSTLNVIYIYIVKCASCNIKCWRRLSLRDKGEEGGGRNTVALGP